MYDIKILNAKFPNFETREFLTDDICIKDGKIVHIGYNDTKATLEIDAMGHITSPGFIDIHMHEEELSAYPDLDNFYIAQRMLKMGVTTALGGNCGINYQEPELFINYLKENRPPINYALLLGYNSLREKIGLKSNFDHITRDQLDIAKKEILKCINLGIKGVSFGIEYSPGIEYLEMLEIANLLDPDKHIITAHYRSDSSESFSSIDEMILLSQNSKIPMQISHIGSCSAYGYMDSALEQIKNARDNNVPISADCYPYNAFCTFIGSTVFDDGCLERWNVTYSDILLTDEPYKNVYCTEDIFNDARKNYPNMLAVAFVMNETEIVTALKSPFVMIASDEIYNGSQGHPRGAGTFPRVLGKYVREENHLSLVDALSKMTMMPAEKLLLHNKGQIKLGFDADITIFDPNIITDKADFVNDPTAPPVGIKHVLLDGNLVLDDGLIINGSAGKFLR